MRTAQKIAYNDFVNFECYNGRREVKEVSFTDCHGDVLVSIEIGYINDEGTYLETRRSFYNFFIGKKGGIFQYSKGYTKIYRKYYEVQELNI